MSTINDRLARVYARSTTPVLCAALEQVADTEGVEYDRVRTWLIGELERRSPGADTATEKLFEGENTADQHTYARIVADAARDDVRAGRA